MRSAVLLLLSLLLAPAATRPSRAAPGMSLDRLAVIDHVAERGLEARGYPGMTVAVGRRDTVVWERGFGGLDWSERSPPANPRTTLYDLASLTKVVATTTAIMVLYDHHRLRLDDPIGRYLPAFRRGARRHITIRMLLEHRGGLPPGPDLWRRAHTPAAAWRALLATRLAYRPGHGQLYSDVGFDLLGRIVERISGERLDRFVTRNVFRRLGMRHTMFLVPRRERRYAAPTEMDPPRGHPLRGEVQDENAYALGGVAGHAGLFSTASDLAIFAQMLLDGGEYHGVRIVSDSTVRLFTARAAGMRALGWEICPGGGSCGEYMSPDAYGHTGYTGTSMWIDPDRGGGGVFAIVLANRIHETPHGHTPPLAVLADVRADIADIAELSVLGDSAGVVPMPSEFRADREIDWTR